MGDVVVPEPQGKLRVVWGWTLGLVHHINPREGCDGARRPEAQLETMMVPLTQAADSPRLTHPLVSAHPILNSVLCLGHGPRLQAKEKGFLFQPGFVGSPMILNVKETVGASLRLH